MAFQHKMQRNRFEFKYLIDERCAHDVRTFARSHLVRDEFARAEMKWAYPTHSVYLDGPGLPLYQATVQGHKNRYKLRLRYYSEAESAPVFFEIKRRISDIVLKDRALVKRDRAMRILAGEPPRVTDLIRPGDLDAWSALRRFCDMRDNLAATPRVYVSYLREAWVNSGDNNVRLTFDRELCGGRFDGTLAVRRDVFPPPLLAGHPCVLELKFADRFPHWFREMVAALNLERRNNAKYVQTLLCIPRPRGERAPAVDWMNYA
jgi:hypothetical protein